MQINIIEKDGVITGLIEETIIIGRYYTNSKLLKLYSTQTTDFEQARLHLEMQGKFVDSLVILLQGRD